MSKKILVTFDIDGTLIAFGGSSRNHPESFSKAFSSHYGKIGYPEAFLGYKIDGKTDFQVTKEMLQKLEVDSSYESIKSMQEEIERNYFSYTNDPPNVLPGVEKLLNSLCNCENVVIGIASGNFPEIGWKKLEITNLLKYFPDKICGMGDFPTRIDALNDARERAEIMLKQKFDICFHVGDTLTDASSAHSAGFYPIVVNTGRHKYTEFDFDALVIDNFLIGFEKIMEKICS